MVLQLVLRGLRLEVERSVLVGLDLGMGEHAMGAVQAAVARPVDPGHGRELGAGAVHPATRTGLGDSQILGDLRDRLLPLPS